MTAAIIVVAIAVAMSSAISFRITFYLLFVRAFIHPAKKIITTIKRTTFFAAMANSTVESRARSLFRSALYLHYIEGLQSGPAVEQWLVRHGGWFHDEQRLYSEGTPEDDPEQVVSLDPVRAMEDAKSLMVELWASLISEIGSMAVESLRRGYTGSDLEDRARSELAGTARAWLEEVVGLPPLEAQPSTNLDLAAMLSTAAAGVAVGFGGTSTIGAFSPSSNEDFDDNLEDVMTVPGLMRGTSAHLTAPPSFTGTAHRLA